LIEFLFDLFLYIFYIILGKFTHPYFYYFLIFLLVYFCFLILIYKELIKLVFTLENKYLLW